MVIDKIARNQQLIADNLNPADSVTPIIKQHVEIIECIERTTQLTDTNIGHSFILGSSTNGILGTNTGTQDGEQQVLGRAGDTGTIFNVSNPNNLFQEFLDFILLVDARQTSATIDTTNQKITF